MGDKEIPVDAIRHYLYCAWAFPQEQPYKTLVFKGFCAYVNPEPFQVKYYVAGIDSSYLVKGDRILILDRCDAEEITPYLNKEHYRIIDNWLNSEQWKELLCAMTLVHRWPENRMFSFEKANFLIPTCIVIWEKIAGQTNSPVPQKNKLGRVRSSSPLGVIETLFILAVSYVGLYFVAKKVTQTRFWMRCIGIFT
jgi:hypothetical protein